MSLLLSPLWPPRLPTVVRTLCMICVVGWWCVFHAVFSLSAYRINYHRLYREQLWIDNKMSLYTDQRQRTSYTHNSSIFMLNKCGHKKKYINYINKQTTKTKSDENNSCTLLILYMYIQKGQRIGWKNGNARLHDVKHDLCKNLGTRWNADIVADVASDYFRWMNKRTK